MNEDNERSLEIEETQEGVKQETATDAAKEIPYTEPERTAASDMNNSQIAYSTERTKKRDGKLKKALIILACIFGGMIILGLLGNHVKDRYWSPVGNQKINEPYIAALYVEGTIMSGQSDSFGFPVGYQHQWTLDKLDSLMVDENNRGILLFIDSPGGGVYESDELYLKLKDYRYYTERPVYAVMGSMAASGGYYIAAAADEIIANRNTWTGSIGVTIGTLYDISEFLDRYGVKTVTITSGDNKAMGSVVEPLTTEQQAIFQSLVDEAYDQFVGIIADERGMELQEVIPLADGRIYTATQALEAGLIDYIGTMQDAADMMRDEYDLWHCDVIDMVYNETSLFGNLFRGVKIPNIGGGDATAIMEIVERNAGLPIRYENEYLKSLMQ